MPDAILPIGPGATPSEPQKPEPSEVESRTSDLAEVMKQPTVPPSKTLKGRVKARQVLKGLTRMMGIGQKQLTPSKKAISVEDAEELSSPEEQQLRLQKKVREEVKKERQELKAKEEQELRAQEEQKMMAQKERQKLIENRLKLLEKEVEAAKSQIPEASRKKAKADEPPKKPVKPPSTETPKEVQKILAEIEEEPPAKLSKAEEAELLKRILEERDEE